MRTAALEIFFITVSAMTASALHVAADDGLQAQIAQTPKVLNQNSRNQKVEARAAEIESKNLYYEMFEKAVTYGDAVKAREALSARPELVNILRMAGKYPLLVAAERGHTEVMKVLLEYKADVTKHGDGLSSGGSMKTALHLAAAAGNTEMVELLLQAGAVADDRGEFSRNTPLMLAVKNGCSVRPPGDGALKEVAKRLLQKGANIFATNFSYYPICPLRQAIDSGRLDWTELLLTNAAILPQWTNQPESLLHTAARMGLPKAVDALLKRGIPVNGTNLEGFTPFQLLALLEPTGQPVSMKGSLVARKLETGDILKAAGAQLDMFVVSGMGDVSGLRALAVKDRSYLTARDPRGRTPLHWAVIAGQSDAAKALIDLGADPKAADKGGRVPLHEASARDDSILVALLLTDKASPSSADQRGRTPLHEAAERGCTNVIIQLLAADCEVNAKDNEGNTALDLAAKHNYDQVVKVLLAKRAKPNKGDVERARTTPLHSEIASGNLELSRTLLRGGSKVNALDAEGKRPIHLAVQRKDLAMVELLLKWGADINGRDSNGNTALHYCLPCGNDVVAAPPPEPNWRYKLVQLIGLTNFVSMPPASNPPPMSLVGYLLDHKANPNATNFLGQAVLHNIAQEQMFHPNDNLGSGFPDEEARVVALLVRRGANINAPDAEGMTPLHLVAGRSSMHAARLLLAQGANPNARARDGRTPLHLAAENVGWKPDNGWGAGAQNMVTSLLKAGAKVNAQANDGTTPLHVMVIQRRGFKKDWIPLLLRAGADVNQKDKAGRTPLHAVFATGWPWNDVADIIKLLVAAGADLNARDNNGRTPVHYFAGLTDRIFFLRRVPEALLTDKADVNAEDNEGITPLQLTAHAGNTELMTILTEKGARPKKEGQNKAKVVPPVASGRPIMGMNNLHMLIGWGDTNGVKKFLDAAPELVNKPDARRGELPLQVACSRDKSDMIELLLAKGAEIDPFSAVCLGRDMALAEALKKTPSLAGTNWFFGSPLLFHAARRGHDKCVELLIQAGADINTDLRLHTPLFAALNNGHTNCAQVLQQHGAVLNIFDAVDLGDLKTLTAMLQAIPEAVQKAGYNGITPLLQAVYSQKLECARLLLRRGADPSTPDHTGFLPLHVAACQGDEEMVRLLVEYKADVNASHMVPPNSPRRKNIETGNRPLHYAAQTGREKIVELLLTKGADVNATNLFGKTALFLAERVAVAPEAVSILLRARIVTGPRGPYPERRSAGLGLAGEEGISFEQQTYRNYQNTNAATREAIRELLKRFGARDVDAER